MSPDVPLEGKRSFIIDLSILHAYAVAAVAEPAATPEAQLPLPLDLLEPLRSTRSASDGRVLAFTDNLVAMFAGARMLWWRNQSGEYWGPVVGDQLVSFRALSLDTSDLYPTSFVAAGHNPPPLRVMAVLRDRDTGAERFSLPLFDVPEGVLWSHVHGTPLNDHEARAVVTWGVMTY